MGAADAVAASVVPDFALAFAFALLADDFDSLGVTDVPRQRLELGFVQQVVT